MKKKIESKKKLKISAHINLQVIIYSINYICELFLNEKFINITL